LSIETKALTEREKYEEELNKHNKKNRAGSLRFDEGLKGMWMWMIHPPTEPINPEVTQLDRWNEKTSTIRRLRNIVWLGHDYS
jgi:hypothetical protein